MKGFLRRHRTLLAALACLLVLQASFLCWKFVITAPPLNVPVPLSPSGTVQSSVRVPIPERYELQLAFDKSGHEFRELNELLGGSRGVQGGPAEPGVHVRIRWSLTGASTGEVAASGELNSFGVSIWAADTMSRTLDTISVPPGAYTFRAQVLRDVPELEGVKARLGMHLDPKRVSSSQMAAVDVGMLILVFTLPATVVIVLVLAWHAVLECLKTWRILASP